MTSLRLKDVSVSRAGLRAARADPGQGEDGPVLDAVSLEVQPGERLALLGESGGGKTTLLKLCDRLVEADQGEVEVLGRSVSSWEVGDLRRQVIFVGQRPVAFGGTVRDELTQPLEWADRRASDEDLQAALAVVHLAVPLDRDGGELSGGERGRLGLARALLLEPRILLLDEPTGSLDVRTARDLLAALAAWADEREVTLLVVTHRPEDLRVLGGRAALLLGGRLLGPFEAQAVADGAVEKPAVREFLGALPRSDP